MNYANEFNEILNVLKDNLELKKRVIKLIQNKPILGKVIEEEDRVNIFRKIMIELVECRDRLDIYYKQVELKLPRDQSKYVFNNNVFARGWAERLIRTNLSRFYNQAVLEELDEKGEEECFVPTSSSLNLSSICVNLQNQNYKVKILLQNLINNYELGQYDGSIKFPEHPNCSHVVKPLDR